MLAAIRSSITPLRLLASSPEQRELERVLELSRRLAEEEEEELKQALDESAREEQEEHERRLEEEQLQQILEDSVRFEEELRLAQEAEWSKQELQQVRAACMQEEAERLQEELQAVQERPRQEQEAKRQQLSELKAEALEMKQETEHLQVSMQEETERLQQELHASQERWRQEQEAKHQQQSELESKASGTKQMTEQLQADMQQDTERLQPELQEAAQHQRQSELWSRTAEMTQTTEQLQLASPKAEEQLHAEQQAKEQAQPAAAESTELSEEVERLKNALAAAEQLHAEQELKKQQHLAASLEKQLLLEQEKDQLERELSALKLQAAHSDDRSSLAAIGEVSACAVAAEVIIDHATAAQCNSSREDGNSNGNGSGTTCSGNSNRIQHNKNDSSNTTPLCNNNDSHSPKAEPGQLAAEAGLNGSPAASQDEGKGTSKGKGKTKGSPPPPPKASSTPNGSCALPAGKGKGKSVPRLPAGKGEGKSVPPKAPPRGGPALPKAGLGKPAKPHGPEPRKAEVKPGVTMKKLFWNSFVLDNTQLDECRSNVWMAIEEAGSETFDTEELEQLFAEAQPGRALPGVGGDAGGKAGGNRQKRQRVKVFDESRRRQVCIMLARLPSVEDTVAAVAEMNDARLDKDQIELLLPTVPSAEELATLQSTAAAMAEQGQPVIWDHAEDFALKLGKVPSFALRLQVWSFENSFEERFGIFHSAATEVKDACHGLRSSSRTPRLLGLALAIGNYLNAGTARGRADGFSIEVLAQMRTLKVQAKGVCSGSSTTLLEFLVRQAERCKPGDLGGLFTETGEATIVHKASRHKLADLSQELSAYVMQAQGLARRGREQSADDEVLGIRAERVEARLQELGALQKMFAEAEEDYKKVCVWLHEGGGKKPRPTDELFGHWDAFFQEVRLILERISGGRTKRPSGSSAQAALRPLEQYERSLTPGETTKDGAVTQMTDS